MIFPQFVVCLLFQHVLSVYVCEESVSVYVFKYIKLFLPWLVWKNISALI